MVRSMVESGLARYKRLRVRPQEATRLHGGANRIEVEIARGSIDMASTRTFLDNTNSLGTYVVDLAEQPMQATTRIDTSAVVTHLHRVICSSDKVILEYTIK